MKIILASGSPRRHFLLNMINLPHEVIPSSVNEIVNPTLKPHEVAEELALQKGSDVAQSNPGKLIIAADTIVVLDDVILGKPSDFSEAFSMLSQLSGRTHEVITGVALIKPDGLGYATEITVFHVSTSVTFAKLTPAEIKAYIQTGSPMDKAGSYGIQDDFGSLFVSRIDGDYFNVVGLPIQKLYETLKSFESKAVEQIIQS